MRLGELGVVVLAHPGSPEVAGRAILGDLFKEVNVGVKKEREPRGNYVDVEPALSRQLHVGKSVGQREGQFLDRGGAGFTDVIAGNGN